MSFTLFWRRCLAVAGCAAVVSGCSPKEHDAVVATVGGDPITLSQYEAQYLKNAPSRDSARALTMPERKQFLDLIVNYHLKLKDAAEIHLANRPDIKSEIQQYKGTLTQSYITEREIVQPALLTMYNRRKEELRARHILLDLKTNATPAESLAAYKKADEIIAELKKGTSFDLLAKQYSIDPSAKENGGDLYYFTSGMMVPDFEDALYGLPVGQYGLVRTRFGLHIVQVTDRRPSEGEIHCAHIMVRFPTMNPQPKDTAKAYEEIAALMDSLKQGDDFAGLAMRHSGDPGSAPKGGDLGWFSRRRWVIPFDEAAFKLKPGETSGIVRSPYGYHIIRCLGQRPLKTYEEMKPELQQIYQQSRARTDYEKYMSGLERAIGFQENDAPVWAFLATCDSNKSTRMADWDSSLTADLGRAVVFRARGEAMPLDSVLAMIRERPDFPAALLRRESFVAPLNKVKEQFTWSVAADSLAGAYPEFASVLRDYRDGVLLYQMEQDSVWGRIAPTDSILRLFYDQHKSSFVWPDRLDITELHMASLPQAEKVMAKVKAGETLEKIADDDSVRLARKTKWNVVFDGTTARLTTPIKKAIAEAAREFRSEPGLVLDIVAHQDTGKGPSATAAPKRLEAIKQYLASALKVDTSRVHARSEAYGGILEQHMGNPELWQTSVRKVDLVVSGRDPLVLTRPISSLIARTGDERAVHADSLQPGEVSAPFKFQNLYAIVRLNGMNPSHIKSYAEAQAEVSGMYQDTTAERLKDEWIKGLRARYPVREYVDVLRSAFAPPEK